MKHPEQSFLIREATPEDIPTVVQLNHEGILSWGAGFQPVLQEWMDSVCNVAYFNELIHDTEKTLLVAEYQGKIVGTAYGYPEHGRFYIGGLYLSLKGNGIATSLLAALIIKARKLGYKELSATIYEENYQALRFFSRMGWVHKNSQKYDGIKYHHKVLVLS